MYKYTAHYEDFDGNPVTEDLYFALSKNELVKMDMSSEGGLEKNLRKAIDSKDNKLIMETFDRIITSSYGVKSEDGKRFYKNEKVTEDFKASPAYDEIFMHLFTNEEEASNFVKRILPHDLSTKVEEEMNKNKASLPESEDK